jgi:hypothetical protein
MAGCTVADRPFMTFFYWRDNVGGSYFLRQLGNTRRNWKGANAAVADKP